MDTRDLIVGSRIEHPAHGAGTVTFIGADYLGIAFDDGGEALIRRDALESDAPVTPEPSRPKHEIVPWPDSTFVPEGGNARHFRGFHWDPFVEDSKDVMMRLPEIVPNARVQTGFGEFRKPVRSMPGDWPRGCQLVWPSRTEGLAMVLRIEKEANVIVSLFPFFASGTQQTLTLRKVTVWDGGLEAQITVSWGESNVVFFDSQFVVNRAWYEAGKEYEFILAGVAYDAQPAEKLEWTVNRHPDEVAWMNQHLAQGEAPHEATCTISLNGAAIFLPVEGWDMDDYSFRARTKSVQEFKDWLGQNGWRVRATVMRFGDEEADLDILITRRAWSGEGPPRVGEDIEGRLWLQGYLWMAENGRTDEPKRRRLGVVT